MESENSYEFAENFLNHIIEGLSQNSKKNLNIDKQIQSSFGTAFNQDEIDILKTSSEKDLKDKILFKFNNKRDERKAILGEDKSKEIEKNFLQLIDQSWKMHIQYLEQLRQVIGLRSYGQRDPLIEYKKEAFNLFEDLLEKLKNQFIALLINIKIVDKSEEENNKSIDQKKKLKEFASKKTGRNDPCPCGSGKKYKHCCGSL